MEIMRSMIALLFLLVLVNIGSCSKKHQKKTPKEIARDKKKKIEERKKTRADKKIMKNIQLSLIDTGIDCIYMQVDESVAISANGTKVRAGSCAKKFNFRYIDTEPYSGWEARDLLERIVKFCCQSTIKKVQIGNVSSLTSEGTLGKDVDFIYPVFAYTNSEIVYGYYFIPLLDPPGAFYVTTKSHFGLKELMEQCMEMWPLLLLSLLLVILAGFIAWTMETWSNQQEFPRPFVRGWFEGIWWSFVSMTTVGYGDKAPRSTAGRIFSIIWILGGIVIFSIVSGQITTIIIDANSVETRGMAGETVGVLSNRLYDKGLVTRHGGTYKTQPRHEADEYPEVEQLYWLIEQLEEGNIDGFLLDKFTFWKMSGMIQQMDDFGHLHHEYLCDFFLEKTITTDVPHSGDVVSYGVLVKSKAHHEFFKPVIEGNKLYLQTVISNSSLFSAEYSATKEPNIFKRILKENAPFFCGAIGAILCLGVMAESYRNKRRLNRARKSVGRRLSTIGEKRNANKLTGYQEETRGDKEQNEENAQLHGSEQQKQNESF